MCVEHFRQAVRQSKRGQEKKKKILVLEETSIVSFCEAEERKNVMGANLIFLQYMSNQVSFRTTVLKNELFCTHSSVIGIASTSPLSRLVTLFLMLPKVMQSLQCFFLKLA